jgi:hypothetical protein
MSVSNLKKPSKTNWARIDRMTDEDIDTSDSPPLDDAFFAAAQLLLPRVSIYLFDLREARKFADYILKRTLHSKKSELRQLEHLAFNTSLIISYSRPFKRSYNFKDEGSSLEGYEKKVLDDDEVELHRRILGLRDRAYAHSDASSHLFEGFDYSKFVAFYRPIEILDKSATEQLKLIIGKWISYLETQKSKLKKSQTRRT